MSEFGLSGTPPGTFLREKQFGEKGVQTGRSSGRENSLDQHKCRQDLSNALGY
jgi:hypothetical protein